MTTFGTMIDRIENEIGRSDLTDEIKDEIRSAVDHYRYLRTWYNEVYASTSLTLSSSQEWYTLPSGLERIDRVMITDSGGSKYEITQYPYSAIDEWQDGNSYGTPTGYTVYRNQIRYWPIPDASLTVQASYIKHEDTLSATSESTFWTTDGEAMIRARARQSLKINYLEDSSAMQIAIGMSAKRKEFLSPQEEAAYKSIVKRTEMRMIPNTIRAWTP